METIRKQASKLREQVAKQQQAVLKQLSGRLSNDSATIDESEIQCHQQLKTLYGSTRAAKHFQRDLVRGIEGFMSASSKQMEIVKKLAEDCYKYGDRNQSSGSSLARASLQFGDSHNLMEKERENLLKALGSKVSAPLRVMISGAPLEDARHLTHRYERIRQEVEDQAAEVVKRQLKSRDSGGSTETSIKLQLAESKFSDLRTALAALGREATAAMTSVEAQQQKITYQRLLDTVDAERSYHQNVSKILDELHAQMIRETQLYEARPNPSASATPTHGLPECVDTDSNKSGDLGVTSEKDKYFIAKVSPSSSTSGDLGVTTDKDKSFIAKAIHSFDAQAEGELSLSVGDYVLVRQVTPNGWSEGECKGKAGWFPSAYIERHEKLPASKFDEGFS